MKKILFITLIVAFITITGDILANNSSPPGHKIGYLPSVTSASPSVELTGMFQNNTAMTIAYLALGLNQNQYCMSASKNFGVMQKSEATMLRQTMGGHDTQLIVNYSFANMSNTGNPYVHKGGAILHRMQKAELIVSSFSFNTANKSAKIRCLTGGTNLYRILRTCLVANYPLMQTANNQVHVPKS